MLDNDFYNSFIAHWLINYSTIITYCQTIRYRMEIQWVITIFWIELNLNSYNMTKFWRQNFRWTVLYLQQSFRRRLVLESCSKILHWSNLLHHWTIDRVTKRIGPWFLDFQAEIIFKGIREVRREIRREFVKFWKIVPYWALSLFPAESKCCATQFFTKIPHT